MLKENKGGGVNLKSSCCLSKNHSSCFCFPCAFVLASLLPPSLSYNSFDWLMCAPVLCSTFNYFSYLYHVDSIPLFDSCRVHLWLLFLVLCSYSSVFCLVIGLFSKHVHLICVQPLITVVSIRLWALFFIWSTYSAFITFLYICFWLYLNFMLPLLFFWPMLGAMTVMFGLPLIKYSHFSLCSGECK